MAWGLLPLFYAAAMGCPIAEIGVLAAAYPGGVGPSPRSGPAGCPTGSAASRLIVGGMFLQARRHRRHRRQVDLRRLVRRLGRSSGSGPRWSTRPCSPRSPTWPTPAWRGSAIGVYRLWRDLGFRGRARSWRVSSPTLRDASRDHGRRGAHGSCGPRRLRPDARDAPEPSAPRGRERLTARSRSPAQRSDAHV